MNKTNLSYLKEAKLKMQDLKTSIPFGHMNTNEGLQQINVDEFDEVAMGNVLRTYGSFEVVGPTIDDLSEQALKTFQESKKLLNLPIDALEKVYCERFNGFQNVLKETSEAFQLDGKTTVLNQIAYHFKPYLGARVPEGMKDLRACGDYYKKAENFLHRLYKKISDSFIEPNQRNIFKKDKQNSCLTLRRYFSGKQSEPGTIAHTDFSILTLVVSNHNGLEILDGKNIKKGPWVKVPYGSPVKPRFYINVGDWLYLQMGNEEFGRGVHRVCSIEEERYSLIFFLNPIKFLEYSQKLKTLDGDKIDYLELKKAYQHEGWPV